MYYRSGFGCLLLLLAAGETKAQSPSVKALSPAPVRPLRLWAGSGAWAGFAGQGIVVGVSYDVLVLKGMRDSSNAVSLYGENSGSRFFDTTGQNSSLSLGVALRFAIAARSPVFFSVGIGGNRLKDSQPFYDFSTGTTRSKDTSNTRLGCRLGLGWQNRSASGLPLFAEASVSFRANQFAPGLSLALGVRR